MSSVARLKTSPRAAFDAVERGYCVVDGRGRVLGHTLRGTKSEARNVIFPLGDIEACANWGKRQEEGWSIQPVSARITIDTRPGEGGS